MAKLVRLEILRISDYTQDDIPGVIITGVYREGGTSSSVFGGKFAGVSKIGKIALEEITRDELTIDEGEVLRLDLERCEITQRDHEYQGKVYREYWLTPGDGAFPDFEEAAYEEELEAQLVHKAASENGIYEQ